MQNGEEGEAVTLSTCGRTCACIFSRTSICRTRRLSVCDAERGGGISASGGKEGDAHHVCAAEVVLLPQVHRGKALQLLIHVIHLRNPPGTVPPTVNVMMTATVRTRALISRPAAPPSHCWLPSQRCSLATRYALTTRVWNVSLSSAYCLSNSSSRRCFCMDRCCCRKKENVERRQRLLPVTLFLSCLLVHSESESNSVSRPFKTSIVQKMLPYM